MHTYGEPIAGTREEKIRKIEQLPDDLERVVAGPTDAQLDTPYRSGGSLTLLRPLQLRLAAAFRNARPEDWSRAARHPDWGRLTLEEFLNEYAWHGHHHLEQIAGLKQSMAS